MSSRRIENINSSFFDGYYKEIWRSIIPEALTRAEIDFFIEEAKLQPGDRVLDLMCGYGRHALALARRGIRVTAVDNLPGYITEVKEVAEKENLPLEIFEEDVIEFLPSGEYDLIICMGNSLSFFNKENTQKLFSKISSHLKKGNKFIFNSWMLAEIAIKQFKEKSWSYMGDLKFLTDSKYLFSPARIETETFFIAPDGTTEVKNAIDYIYSLNETETMLNESGLLLKETWSIPGKKKFTLGEPRIYIAAEK